MIRVWRILLNINKQIKEMISFKDFQTLLEGKKKENQIAKRAKEIAKNVKKQVQNSPGTPVVADYGGGEAGSTEREASLRAMMKRDAEWRKSMKKKQAETP